jgi:GxxExxY protein
MTNAEPSRLLHHELTDKLLGVFFDTYNELGYGFSEFVCSSVLAIALADAGLEVVQEARLPVTFRGRIVATFRADIVVNGVVIVEVKARPEIERRDQAQVLNYLKASGFAVGLVVNFGPRPTFKRVVYETARFAHLVPTASAEESKTEL